jgi:hypothetical protein
VTSYDVLCCVSQVKYVTIAGTFVKGVKASGEGTLLQKFAGAGYQQVRGLGLKVQACACACLTTW